MDRVSLPIDNQDVCSRTDLPKVWLGRGASLWILWYCCRIGIVIGIVIVNWGGVK